MRTEKIENNEKRHTQEIHRKKAEQTTTAQGANPAYIVTAWPEA